MKQSPKTVGSPVTNLDEKSATGKDLGQWGSEETKIHTQMFWQQEETRFFRRAFGLLAQTGVYGDYHEYEIRTAGTFCTALAEARRHNLSALKFFAFGEFEKKDYRTDLHARDGRATQSVVSQAEFQNAVQEHGIYADRVKTVKGIHCGKLTKEYCYMFLDTENKIGLVTIGCDSYEAAVPVLTFVEPLLQEGAVIYMPHLFAGPKGVPTRGVGRAFLEFQKRSRWSFVRHLDVGWWGRSYLVYLDSPPDGVL